MSPTNPQTYTFKPIDPVPNHPTFPLLIYSEVLKDVENPEALLTENGWVGLWRNGVYPYHHYHTTSHEVLAVVSGEAQVQFGGLQGKTLELARGDVAVLPAGTGHCCLSSSPGFEVIGGYPEGQENWDLKRDAPSEADLRRIKELPRPATDPVYGTDGPLLRLWTGK